MNKTENGAINVAWTVLFKKEAVTLKLNTEMTDHVSALNKILDDVDKSRRESQRNVVTLNDENERLQMVLAAQLRLNQTLLGQISGLKVALMMEINKPQGVGALGTRFNTPPSEAVSEVKQRLAAGEKLTNEDIPTVAVELFQLFALGKNEEARNFLQPPRTFADVETLSEIENMITTGPLDTDLSITMQSTDVAKDNEEVLTEKDDAAETLFKHERAGGASDSFEKLDSLDKIATDLAKDKESDMRKSSDAAQTIAARDLAGAQSPSGRAFITDMKRNVDGVLQTANPFAGGNDADWD
jgi:hypothetical protein